MKSNKEKYIEFCLKENDLPIFFQHWYLDQVCPEGKWNVVIVEKSGKIAGIMTYYIKSKIGFDYITMPPLTKFMGPYIIEKYKHKSQSIYKDLIKQLPKVDHFIQNFYYQADNWTAFHRQDYHQQTLYSQVVDEFDDMNVYFISIDRYYKKIVKTSKENLQVVHNIGTIKESIRTSFQLIGKTFERQKLECPFSFEIYSQLIETLIEKKSAKLFFTKNKKGNITSTAILIWDNTSAYYLISGEDPAFRKSNSGIYLIYEMIKYTSEVLAIRKFDFLGSMIPSLEIIRRKFASKTIPYYEIKKTDSRLFELIRKLKNI